MFAKLFGGLLVAAALAVTAGVVPAVEWKPAVKDEVTLAERGKCCRPGMECCKGGWQKCCRR